MPAATHAVAGAEPVVARERASNLVTVEAPMVGTFYRASCPDRPTVRARERSRQGRSDRLHHRGDEAHERDRDEVGGRIAKILVENGQAVEYGQPLFLIDPSR
jgi:acetyl-CoA carboxylase biotin carboxyl carrier protein